MRVRRLTAEGYLAMTRVACFIMAAALMIAAAWCASQWLSLSGDRSLCSSGVVAALNASGCAATAQESTYLAAGTFVLAILAVLLLWRRRKT